MAQQSIPCTLVRGGTSKGVFVQKSDVPAEAPDHALLSIFGSPDSRQIDGVGGATPTTSKLIIVEAVDRTDIDISYTFGQVAVEDASIDYSGNCGNMTSGVGAFAVDEGLVETDPEDEEVTVRLYNTNTDSRLDQTVPLIDGQAATNGNFKVHGVPGTGARVETTYYDPDGAFTGDLFPLGEPTTDLLIDGETVAVSVVDVTTPVVFIHAATLGLDGTELPSVVNDDGEAWEQIDRIRGEICVRLGLVDDRSDAATESPNYPKLAFVAPPTGYQTTAGESVEAAEIDLVARVTSMPVLHPVYAVTSASCTAAAVNLPGTIPHEITATHADTVTLGHPKGTMTIRVDVDANRPAVNAVTIGRTQRRLMDGIAYY